VLTARLRSESGAPDGDQGGLPQSVPAMTINAVCGSGLKAVMLGAQAITRRRLEESDRRRSRKHEHGAHLHGSRDGQRMGDWSSSTR